VQSKIITEINRYLVKQQGYTTEKAKTDAKQIVDLAVKAIFTN
jgi:predicted RNase H-like HicB family nuclease